MKRWQEFLNAGFRDLNNTYGGANVVFRRRLCRYAIVVAVGLVFAATLESVSFAQRTTTTSSKRGFNIYGDVRVDESQGSDPKPLTLDIILYTKGDQVVQRQRISPNGRYRFMDIFDGDYYIAIEVENKEVARLSVFISTTSPVELKQDIALEWRATGGRNPSPVVSAADFYDRSASNKTLYQKSVKEIDSKNYPDAIATLRQLVALDPNDFQAWSDLGMVYFVVQKDYEAAENCYTSALTSKPTYFQALLNLGRVRLARKNYEGAIESLERALKVEPKSGAGNYFLGEAYLQMKKGSKAVGYLNQALILDPEGMAEAHLRLAALYNGAGMKDKAAAEYEQFLKKKPTYQDRPKLEKYIAENKKP